MLVPLIIFITSLVIIPFLIPDFHPFGGLKISRDEQTIIKESKKYLDKIEIQYDESKLNLEFETNAKFVRWINSEHKLNDANKILRRDGSAYYWSVNQKLDDENEITVSSNSSESINRSKTKFNLNLLDDGKDHWF